MLYQCFKTFYLVILSADLVNTSTVIYKNLYITLAQLKTVVLSPDALIKNRSANAVSVNFAGLIHISNRINRCLRLVVQIV